MLKHLYFLGAAFNSLVLYWYIADDHLPQKFNIIAWGCFTVIVLFLEALKSYYIEKTQAILKNELEEIMENKSLTENEKKAKIMQSFIVNRTRKKEKNDE